MARRRLEVEIVGDSRKLEKTLGRTESRLQMFGRRVDKQTGGAFGAAGGKAFAGGLIGAAALSQAKAAVDVASNLNEQVSKSSVVFGSAAADVQKWAGSTASSIGLANDKALEAAGTYGLLFRNIGEGETEAARLSQSLVTLASDLASFNNTSLEEALLAIRSGLTGEIEPLRKFGVFLSEARTKTQALADTGKTAAASLTTQDKVLARYKLLLQDTSMAQGDFARTSEGLANQQRILAAQSRDLQASIGSALVPALTDVVLVMNEGITMAEKFADALNKIPGAGPGGGKDGKKGGILNTGVTGSDLAVIPLFKVTADLLRLLKEPSTSEKTAAAAKAFAPLAPPLTGRRISDDRPQSVFDLAAKPPPSKSVFGRTEKAVEKLPVGFQNTILKAQNENDRGALTKSLVNAKQFYQSELQKALDADDSKAVNEIRGNLNGIQSAIQGVYSEIAAETARAKAATEDAAGTVKKSAKDATEDRKAAAAKDKADAIAAADAAKARYRENVANVIGRIEVERTRAELTKTEKDDLDAQRKLVAELRKRSTDPKLDVSERISFAQQFASAALELQTTVADAMEKQTQSLKDQAAKFKSAALERLDRKQAGLETGRALADAQKAYRTSLQINGKKYSQAAFRDLQDARIERQRFELEGAKVSVAKGGGFNINGSTFHFHGVQNVDAFVAQLQKRAKHNTPQSRGNMPGALYGLPH